jgi:hypothetical protein
LRFDGRAGSDSGAAGARDQEREHLAFVPTRGEAEVREAFRAALRVRDLGPAVREIADLHFFETLVRVHRAGEGAPFTDSSPPASTLGP